MKTIHKYEFGIQKLGSFEIPSGAKILTAQWQFYEVVLWAEVDTDNFSEDRKFIIVGTGWSLDDEPTERTYIATVQEPSGYVWHVYEVVGQ